MGDDDADDHDQGSHIRRFFAVLSTCLGGFWGGGGEGGFGGVYKNSLACFFLCPPPPPPQPPKQVDRRGECATPEPLATCSGLDPSSGVDPCSDPASTTYFLFFSVFLITRPSNLRLLCIKQLR